MPDEETSERRRRWRIPLRLVLVPAFGGLMLVAVAGALWLGIGSARQNTLELVGGRAEAAIDSLVRQVESELGPVERQAAGIADATSRGLIDPTDPAPWDTFIAGALAATPQVAGIAVIRPDHSARLSIRGSREDAEHDWSDDPEVIAAVKVARSASAAYWSDPFWTDTVGETLANYQTPLTRDGTFVGLLIQGIRVSRLSAALTLRQESDIVVPFVLYGRERVLAHPLLMQRGVGETPDQPLPTLATFSDTVLAEIWNATARPLDILQGVESLDGSAVDFQDREYVFIHRTISRFGAQPLTVGAYVDASLPETYIRRVQLAGGFGLGVLVVSVVVAALLVRRASSPVVTLAAAARQVRSGALDTVPKLPTTGIRELDDAAQSFNGMVAGLRERELIRGLFGKFVPEAIAAQLIRDKGALAPRRAEATVLFADIAGFTSLTERMGAERIVDMLNAYFSSIVSALEAHRGVVTQFQGDAVLALFNVPAPDPDHAAQAVRAARAMVQVVADQTFGAQRLAIRVGIATGDVVVGNVGAGDRLSFTAHGDVVNLAARLEQMNKTRGTQILVSAETADRATGFPYQPMGEVEVRGKSESVTVFAVPAAPGPDP